MGLYGIKDNHSLSSSGLTASNYKQIGGVMKGKGWLYLSSFCFLLFSLFVSSCGFAESKKSQLDVYFVRHAEIVANVTANYSEKNRRSFTEKGKEQIKRLTEGLKQYKFDEIFVSPKYRTMRTIEPYLQEQGITAELWPELAECCYQSDRSVKLTNVSLEVGARINIMPDEKEWFSFRDKAEKGSYYDVRNYADGMMHLEKSVELIKERFGGTGKTILLVSHSLAGGRIIEMLLGLPPVGNYHPSNARLTHLRMNESGEFEILFFNKDPLSQKIGIAD